MIWLHDDLPWSALVLGIADEAIGDCVRTIPSRAGQHAAQVNLRETAVKHPSQQMWGELEIPLPPKWPPCLAPPGQRRSLRSFRCLTLCRSAASGDHHLESARARRAARRLERPVRPARDGK